MPRFRDYYKQFEAMDPEEVSAELRARREEEKRRALSRVEPLDLTGAGWFEPPHPDAVNAATFALRRALNAYADAAPAREAVAARFGLAPEQVALGHGAGELLRALLPATGDVHVGWPGWQPLPDLVTAAGGHAVPVPPDAPAGDAATVVLTSPSDTAGAVLPRAAVQALCEQAEHATVIVDEALAEFADPDGSAAALVGELAEPRRRALLLQGPRDGRAARGRRARPAGAGGAARAQRRALRPCGRRRRLGRLRPRDGGRRAPPRRRGTLHEQLADGLEGTPFHAAPAGMPFAWIASDGDEDGPAISARLAARQVFVVPGTLWGDRDHVRAQLRGPAGVERLVSALAA